MLWFIKRSLFIIEVLLNFQVQEAFLTKVQNQIKMLGLDFMQTAYKDSSLQHDSYFVSFVLNGVLDMTEKWFKRRWIWVLRKW